MSVLRPLLLVLSALPCLAATFGTVVPHTQPLADLVIDEARSALRGEHLHQHGGSLRHQCQPAAPDDAIKTDATPLSLALSRETPIPAIFTLPATTVRRWISST